METFEPHMIYTRTHTHTNIRWPFRDSGLSPSLPLPRSVFAPAIYFPFFLPSFPFVESGVCLNWTNGRLECCAVMETQISRKGLIWVTRVSLIWFTKPILRN